MGVSNFLEEHKITEDKLPIDEVLRLTKDSFGGDKMRELFNDWCN